jgi:uncharacterized protein with PIN domain
MLRGLADVTGRSGCPVCGDLVWVGGRWSRWN